MDLELERVVLPADHNGAASSPTKHESSTALFPNLAASYRGRQESAPIYPGNTVVPFPVYGEQAYGNGRFGFQQCMPHDQLPPNPGNRVSYPFPVNGEDKQSYGAGNQGYVLQRYMPPQLPPPPPDQGMPQTAVVVQTRPIKEHYYEMSVVLSVIWCLLCAPYLLCCSISAVFYAQQSKEAARDGDMEAAGTNAQHALHCNIASIVCAVISFIGIIAIISIFVTIVYLLVTAQRPYYYPY